MILRGYRARRFPPAVCFLLLAAAFPFGPAVRADELRVMSWNVSKLTTKAGIETVRIIQGLQPDVACIQEWYVDYPADYDFSGWVSAAFGPEFVYHRASSGYQPNGIVSRWNILSSGSWPDLQRANYYHDWAVIDLPGDTNLQVVSVHLHSSDEGIRIEQIKDVIDYIEANFSNSHYVMINGDFNTANRTSQPIPTLLNSANWSGSCWVTTSDGTPVDQVGGDDDTNLVRTSNYDWLIPNLLLGNSIMDLDLGEDSGVYAGGIVFDSRVFMPLSAVAPIQYGDTANGDQDHCPIMKSYDVLPAASLVDEDFEGLASFPPPGWLDEGLGDVTDLSTAQSRSPTYSARFNANGDYLITPLLPNPGTLTYYMYATAGATIFNVQYSSSTSGPWNHLAGSPTITDYGASFKMETFDLSSHSNIYIRFSRGTIKTYYLDDVLVTLGGGSPPASGDTVKVNFQPSGAEPPAGDWMRDWGSGNNGLSHVPPYSFSW
jgi:hypothetical protein